MMAISPGDFGALVGLMFVGVGGLTLVKAWARKIENQSKAPPALPENAARMERMERAIDSIALEIERISENQRFLTKLLAERNEHIGALPRQGASREDRL
jgi:hypothetical protein